ncbi:MAG: hypothetical protein FJZ09_05785 [Candidatus Omnitrophica bacterium]|nr:hypothetical protein [Candidatus Omnitrophota bacterium]
MTRSKTSLRNSVRRALSLALAALLVSGCTYPANPTFKKQEIVKAIQDICKKEYKIDARVFLAGRTLWVYVPLEIDMFQKADKPEKVPERFSVEQNKAELLNDLIKLDYSIKPVEEKMLTQEYKFNKDFLENNTHAWSVIRRVLFSMERLENNEELQFLCLITADIKAGAETVEIAYQPDLKKASYGLLSLGEYQHRAIYDMIVDPQIIGDKEGRHLNFKDLTLREFVVGQIQNRIRLKFQRPEVEAGADVDKEITKVIIYVIKTYNFKDFSAAELNNLLTRNKVFLNRAAIWETPIE